MNNNFSERWDQIRNNVSSDKINRELNSFFAEAFYNHVSTHIHFGKYDQLNLFFFENLKNFKIYIYNDNEKRPADGDFEVLLSRSQFVSMFPSVEDVVTNLIHRILHQYIANMWLPIKVSKRLFSLSEIDFLEDIYIQSIVFQTLPFHAKNYIDQLSRYYKANGIAENETFYVETLSLMDNECLVKYEPLLLVHRWLYSQNRLLEIEVFEQFFYIFSKLKNAKEFRQYLHYTILANQEEIHSISLTLKGATGLMMARGPFSKP